MKTRLLDINVLLALAWPTHVHHSQATDWFRNIGSAAFATCPITETGFVRISSNAKIIPEAVQPSEAAVLLKSVCELPGHHFWADGLDWESVQRWAPAIIGHRQVTDARLLALAASNEGVLATLDRGVKAISLGRDELVELVL